MLFMQASESGSSMTACVTGVSIGPSFSDGIWPLGMRLLSLDLDFTDRLVDVIEEGFDVVIRTGVANDSRLMRKSLGRFRIKLVASPAYISRRGMPTLPADLASHDCLRQRSQSTRKIIGWPLKLTVASLRSQRP
jgi:DNA-binding transcriptional LysR family regulator